MKNKTNKLKNKLYSKLELYCARFARALDDIATDYKIPHQINFTSSMMQIFFSEKPVIDYASSMKADANKFNKLFSILLKNKIFIAPSQFEVVFFSNAHTQSDLNKALDAYREGLKAVRN